MKTVSKLICAAGLVAMAATASGQVYWGGDTNVSIPDGDPNGVTLLTTIPAGNPNISTNNFRVYLEIAGDPIGGNGDLNIWLKAPNGGPLVELLNRPGYSAASSSGYQDNGMDVTFYEGTDSTGQTVQYGDIHTYQADPVYGFANRPADEILHGVWKTDGRNLDPLASGTVFDAAPRSATFAGLQGLDPQGNWILFAADISSGGNSRIVDWGIDLTPIPEPQSYAMAIGVGLMGFALYRRRAVKAA